MARLVDAPDDNAVETTEELGTLDEMATEQAAEIAEAEPEPVAEEPQDDDLPEKYRGKSASEIATMHRELEQRLGQQSQEVGDLRKACDEMVKQSIAAQQSQSAPEQEADEIDFFTDPQAAVKRAIENHPMLKQSQAVAAEMAKSQALAQLQAAHPDMKDVLTDPGFKEWIGKSQVRQELFERADKAYDFAAADELMTLYKERRGIVAQTAKVEKVAQQNEIRKASTGSARSNPDSAKTRKIYRRRDIIELMNRDPKRYEALQPEIMRAYAEGRVK
jgi:regulator of replication initiation timing